MFDHTIILRGKSNYLSALKPLLDPVFISGEKKSKKQNHFISFAQRRIEKDKKVAVVDIIQAYIEDGLRKGIAKKTILMKLKPFVFKKKTNTFNTQRLAKELYAIVIYKELKSSIVYAEYVKQ